MEKISPYKCIVVALLAYWLLFFLGPYQYTINNYSGLLYLMLVFGLLGMSCYVGERIGKRDEKERYIVTITKSAEKFLLLVEAISAAAFIIYMWEVIHLPVKGGYCFAADDYRDILSLYRTTVNKIAEVVMYCGTAAYLIISRIPKLNYRITGIVSVGTLFLPAVAILSVGARSRVVTSAGLFALIAILNHDRAGKEKTSVKKVQWGKIFICVFISILAFFTLYLFSSRGIMTAPEQYLWYPGDIKLRPIYEKIYAATHGMVNPLYKASFYLTHSIPVFTKIYPALWTVPCHYGALFFYLEGYMLRLIGIPFPEYIDIASESPASGFFSTFISGYVQDWGMVGTLFFVIATGLLFGRLSHDAYKKKAGFYLMPIVIFMCMVSPIYYFWHMGWECVLLFFPAIYFVCGRLGLRAERLEEEDA